MGTTAEAGREEGVALYDMKLDIPDEDLDLIIKALDYHAYTVARNAEDTRYRDLADRLKRKPTELEPATQPGKNAKRLA
jgi:hypothetical protein